MSLANKIIPGVYSAEYVNSYYNKDMIIHIHAYGSRNSSAQTEFDKTEPSVIVARTRGMFYT